MNRKNIPTGIGRASPILMAACALLFIFAAMTGCKPRTAGEKIKDTVQDAAHETKQGADRAIDNLQK